MRLGEVDIFFDDNDLAVEAVYRDRAGATAENILIIFSSDFSPSVVGENVRYSNAIPTALCKTADIPNASTDSLLKVSGVIYNVLSVQKDAEGLTILELSKD